MVEFLPGRDMGSPALPTVGPSVLEDINIIAGINDATCTNQLG